MGATTFSALTGWLLFAALLGMFGSIAARWLVLPRASSSVPASRDWMELRSARLGRAAAAALLPALLLVLVRQVMEFRDPFAPLSEDVKLLMGTSWGSTWLWAVAAWALALGGFWAVARGRRWGWWVATAAAMGLALFPGLTGHAGGEEGPLRLAALTADALHVLAAGAWIGGLAVVLWLERSWRRSSGGDVASLLPTLVPLFSPVAMASVALLAASGTFASWLQLPGLSALWATEYGRLLSLKLLLVAGVLGLGAVNWKRLTPKLTTSEGPGLLRNAALLELTVAMAVLLVTAVLVRTSPLGH